MYKSFIIKNFRCFKNLTFKPLKQFNLIAGKNNIGKTALLEALWVHHGYQNPNIGIRVDAFRGLTIIREDEIMIHIFNEFDQNKKITLTSTDKKNQKSELTILKEESSTTSVPVDLTEYRKKRGKEVSELTQSESNGISRPEIQFEYVSGNERVNTKAYFDKDQIHFELAKKIFKTLGIFLTPNQPEGSNVIAERLGNMTVKKSEDEVVEFLKIIEPNLERLIVRVAGGQPLIYGDVGKKKLMPLALMGDGMGRLIRIALAIADAHDGIVLIDEIENGIHHKSIKDVWKAIAQQSRKYNTQVFATTHSRECIQSAHEAFSEQKQYDFILHRLEHVKGEITDVAYDKEALEAAMKSKFEVR